MISRRKHILYSVVLLTVVSASVSFTGIKSKEPILITGKTMGTTYHVTYFDKRGRDFKTSVDSLLAVVNKSISNYDPTSEVSRFNTSRVGFKFDLPYLRAPLMKAGEIYHLSGGAFDPTVMPLVNAWGFGPAKPIYPDSAQVDSIRTFVGFDKVRITSDSLIKKDPNVQLDFGGIGQGYGADIIAAWLKSKGIVNMLVELGGEGMAIGRNLKSNKPWSIGILDPNSTYENQFFKAYIPLTNKSFTTSGNYFNYREIDGKKYSHTIDPGTGYPARHAILSASVFTSDAITADVWATAFMVMGHEKAIELLKKHPELDALLIYSSTDGKMLTYITPGIAPFVKLEP